jgi:hypothetical protein
MSQIAIIICYTALGIGGAAWWIALIYYAKRGHCPHRKFQESFIWEEDAVTGARSIKDIRYTCRECGHIL